MCLRTHLCSDNEQRGIFTQCIKIPTATDICPVLIGWQLVQNKDESDGGQTVDAVDISRGF